MEIFGFWEAVVAAILDCASKVVNAGESGEMVGSDFGFTQGKDFAVDSLRIDIVTSFGGYEGEFVHADQGFGVTGTEGLFANLEGALVLLFGFGISIALCQT